MEKIAKNTPSKYMVTLGILWDDGRFSPKSSLEDAVETIEALEGEGTTAGALMGFDPAAETWEVLAIERSQKELIRRVKTMLGLDLDWSDDEPLQFVMS